MSLDPYDFQMKKRDGAYPAFAFLTVVLAVGIATCILLLVLDGGRP